MNGYEKYLQDVNSLIGENRRFHRKADMASFIGVQQAQISRYTNEQKNLSVFFEFLDKLGVQVVFPDQRLEEYEFVPRVKAVAGCGESLVTDGDVAGLYAFRKSFLESLHIKAKDAVMMYVSGDSMQPLICDRDTVLFNTRETEPKEGHLYVVSFGDSLMVKRMQQIPSGWLLCSENPRYSPVQIEGDELAKLRIHGRVRWFGRVL